MFATTAGGVPAREQGIAAGMAATGQQAGLAVLVACPP
jgi:hypothetical protein